MKLNRQARALLTPALLLAGMAMALLGLAPAAQAQTDIYKANNTTALTTTTSWTNATNGAGGNPTGVNATEIGVIDSTVSSANAATLTYTGTLTLGGLKILNPLGPVTINASAAAQSFDLGNSTFANGGGIDLSNATQSLTLGTNDSLVLEAAQTWTVGNATSTPGLTVSGPLNNNGFALTLNGTGPVTLAGIISGGGAFTQNTTNTTILSGLNTYTGATTLNAGTLSVGTLAAGGTPSSIGESSNVSTNLIFNGGELQYTGAGNATDRSFDLGSNGGIIGANGTGALTFNSTSALGFSGTNINTTLTLTGNSHFVNVFDPSIGNNGTGNTSVVVTGSGNVVWALNATNTYSGGTTVSGNATLELENNAAIGTGALTFTGGNSSLTTNATMTLANSNAENWNGSWTYVGANGSLSMNTGAVTLGARNVTVAITANTVTIGGVIADGGALNYSNADSVTETSTGTGNLDLTNTNTFSGNFNLQSGTLTLGNATALQNATLNYTGGTVTYSAGITNITVAGLAGNTNLALPTANLTIATGPFSNGNYSAILSGSGSKVIITGNGTQTLSGANTFTGGVTLNGATLNIDNASALGTGRRHVHHPGRDD